MTIKTIEQYWCDRCGEQFQRTGGVRPVKSMAIGWFQWNNGSGSKSKRFATTMSSSDDLDRDMCHECTESFLSWWKEGKNSK